MKFLFVAQTSSAFNYKCNRYFLKISNNIILKAIIFNRTKYPMYFDDSTLSLTKNKYLIVSRNKMNYLYNKSFDAITNKSKSLNSLIKIIKMEIFK